MINLHKFDGTINQIEAIGRDQSLQVLLEASERLKHVRDDFDMKVLFVGHFSAGKSALLNELIGRGEYLKEGQNPTTAKIQEIRPEDFPGSGLDVLKDFTLVDTPGFDSNIAGHEKALTAAIAAGAGYIVMIDIAKGGLDTPTLSCIEEVAKYTPNVAVILSRCDSSGNTSNNETMEKAREILKDRGLDFPVYCISRNDADAVGKLQSIILAFDGQCYFDRRMRLAIQSELPALQTIVKAAIRKTASKTWSYEEQERALASARDFLRRKLELQKQECRENFERQLDIIMCDLEAALKAKSDLCADVILAKDTQALEAIVLNAIRPVMVHHLETTSSAQIDAFVSNINFTGVTDVELKRNLEDCIVGLAQSTKDLINSGTLGAALAVFADADDKKEQKAEKGNEYYKMATGITALLTDVINPWLEVAIVMLPEIIALCKALLGPSDHEIARDNYEQRIVPVVYSKLYPHVEDTLRKTSDALLDALNQECQRQLQTFDTEMKRIGTEKADDLQKTAERKQQLEAGLKFIAAQMSGNE